MKLSQAFRNAFVPPSTRNVRTSEGGMPVVGAAMVGRFNGVNGTMLAEWDAEAAIHQAYLVNWAVYRCAVINAEKIASLPIRVGKDPTKPEKYDLEAPLAQLLGPAPGGPNVDTSPAELIAHSIASYQVTGRFGWEIAWTGRPGKSKVAALWPLIAQYLWPKPTPSTKDVHPYDPAPPPRYFSGFEYRSQPGAPRELDWQQCFYVWKPSLHDWRQPESALQAARLDIAGMVEQSIYDYAFLKNGAVPASLVVTQEFETPQAYEAFKAQWGYKYGGSANAGKTAFVEMDAEDGNVGQMVDVKLLGATHRDSLADKRYDQKVKAICSAMGTPMSKLDASGRTFNNGEAEDETWEEDTIIPLATRLTEAINIRLAPFLGPEVCWVDLSSLKTQRGKSLWIQVSPLDAFEKGVQSLNETRAVIGQSRINDPAADDVRALANPELPEHATETIDLSAIPGEEDKGQSAVTSTPAPVEKAALSLTRASGADSSTGVMVALMIDAPTASQIATPGGESPDILHITLAYLGSVTNDADKIALEQVAKEFATTQTPIAGRILGKGIFEQPDGAMVVVGLVDVPGLDDLRHGLVRALELAGIQVHNDHSFTPHITLLYTHDALQAANIDVRAGTALSWSSLTVAWGGEYTPFSFSARRQFPVGVKRESLSPEGTACPTVTRGADEMSATDRINRENVRRERLWRTADFQSRTLEEMWTRDVGALFVRQHDATMSRLTGKRGRQAMGRSIDSAATASSVFDSGFWQSETVNIVKPLYRSVFSVVGARMVERFDFDFEPSANYVNEFVEASGHLLASRITQTTYNGIHAVITRGLAEGTDLDEIALHVDGVFEHAQNVRIPLIASNEVHSSYSGATVLIGRELPNVIAAKEWISQRDGDVRKPHAEADGQIVGIGEKFHVGDIFLDRPGDPTCTEAKEVVGCRCFPNLLSVDELAERRTIGHYRRVEEVEAELLRLAAEVAA